MKGQLLEKFRNYASYSQILVFERLCKQYTKGVVTLEEIQLFVVFCTGTIVRNQTTEFLLR